ncbi:class I SAM-dependent methyltransferase [Salidesulfovibrio onnuriiensis]|uniref:class I SAM-dependent methyltransferase n=1 Tax=Salidesulfovibrio onnuriiensis TaxID=2583823 RepID=UPI0011C8DCBD|nr:methyltransferase domain-containing protein [Salidesulfovibrio onnuriiensis]
MYWDAERYESWFDSGEGRFALEREARLLQAMVAGWPRRCTRMLEIGCGTGLFLEMLWQMGFDVTGIDKSDSMIAAARKRFGNRASLHLGDGSHLPFDDDSFEYVFLWSVLEFCADPEAVLREASRVAEKGILVGFLNKASLYYWRNVRGTGGTLARARLFSWFEIRHMVWRVTGFHPSMAHSVLPGPMGSWKEDFPWKQINNRFYPPWMGAFSAMRIDFDDLAPLSPLLAWRSEPEMS